MPKGHRFPMGKFGAIHRYLENQGLLDSTNRFMPTPLEPEILAGVHDADYVKSVLEIRLTKNEERRLGLPLTTGVARRSRAANGGTLLAAMLALEHGVACNLAGGSHHAFRSFGSGFCVFNDVAVTATHLLKTGEIKRAMIVDLDVHQGDGTASMLQHETRLFTLSLHCRTNFPVRKQRSDWDVALEPDLDDRAYLDALDGALGACLERMAPERPDLIFYNAGVDPHKDDRLGRLALSDHGLAERDRMVLSRFAELAIPVICVVGGGYDHDVERLAARHAILHHVIVERPRLD